MKGLFRVVALASGLSLIGGAMAGAPLAAQKGIGGGGSTGAGNGNHAAPPITSGTWHRTNNTKSFGFSVPLLLTDGTVIIQRYQSSNWWKLTPDATGSYVNGTWSQIASAPGGYAPSYYASAVLPDGRVFAMGGEYQGTSGSGVWQNTGAIYDPVTNTWTSVSAPSGWSQIGDAQCVVLPNGTLVLAHPFDTLMASLNASTLTWTALSGSSKGDRFDEEGWTLLPDGTVLTCDAINAPKAERYIPAADKWISASSTIQSLEDSSSQELGPMVLRPDGTVFAMGATGHNAVYTPSGNQTGTGSWVVAPDFPVISQGQLDIADGPACLLPDGNVLCAASPLIFNNPTDFFEFDGTNLAAVNSIPNAPNDSSFVCNLLMLPTGQVLCTDFSSDVEIYTPAGTYQSAWQPTITSVPSILNQGAVSVTLQGTQLNGLSQSSAYGDDSTNATNYPIVRIVNNSSGNVFYQRTHDHSTMAVATGAAVVSTKVDISSSTPVGSSTLYVVANGIPSAGRQVYLFPANVVPATSYSILDGTGTGGNAQSLYYADGNSLNVLRGLVFGTQTAPVQVQVNGTSSIASPSSLTFTLTSSVNSGGVTQNVFLKNNSTGSWDLIDTRSAPMSATTITVNATGNLANYVNAGNGQVSALLTFAPTSNGSATNYSYTASIDQSVWTIH